VSDATKAATPSARHVVDVDLTLPDTTAVDEEGAPERFGRYRVLEPLGEGGMGAVYACFDEVLEREVAVKSMRVPPGPRADARALLERFEREGRVLASLSHPNVVRVHDVGREGSEPFLVMERVRGPSLRERIRRGGPLSGAEATQLGVQLAAALEAAHAAGILHRDVKPANVLEGEGAWILADFGVARAPASQLTRIGQFLGTPGYASPEALLEGEFSEASDVFGWGATMFHALTGEAPYGERGMITVARAQRSGPPPLPRTLRGVPAELAGAIRSALDPDPRARPSARQLRLRLGRPTERRPVLLLAALGSAVAFALGSILGIALGALVWSGSEASPVESPRAPVVAETVSDADRRRRWREIAEDVNGGDYASGRRRLEALLERYPNDPSARELLEQLQVYE